MRAHAPRAPVSRIARWTAAAVAIGVCGFGLVRGTWAAGGSDSSCYALMADAFARGDRQPGAPLAREAPWPDALRTFAPGGFVPSPSRPDAVSPVCAPGFSLLLAPFRLFGGPDGIFVVTPLAGGLAVWLVWIFTARLASPWTALGAVLVVATMPVFLFQVTQPMNDVAATALWMAVLASALTSDPVRPWSLGFFTGLAVLVRPNLAPAAVVVGIWLAALSARAGGLASGLVRRNVLGFIVAGVPAAATLAALNTMLYGGPLRSGYGNAADLFSAGNVMANLTSYGRALLETSFGLPLLGVLAPIFVPRAQRRVAWLAAASSLAVAAVYLFYRPYPEWWYLRFFLPAIVPLTAMAVVAIARAITRLPLGAIPRAALASTLVAALSLLHVQTARDRQAADLHRLERRFWFSARVARDRLPANAIFVTVWESGSLAHHADRPAVLWDSLDPGSLDNALSWLEDRGLEPYLMLEQWEEPAFRQRFEGRSPLGALDWPPRFEIDRQVRIYKPSDRADYLKSGEVRTEHVR